MKSLSPVEIVMDRLRSAGYAAARSTHREGVAVSGVPDWTIVWTERVDAPEQVLARLGAGFSCVLCVRHGRLGNLQALLWTDDLAQAVEKIREGAIDNARLASGAHDLLSRADLRARFEVDGRRGCSLSLADWTFLLLGWRLALRYRRRGLCDEVVSEGTRIGRYIAHDYDAVRAGQLSAELDQEVALYGQPLISSPMGPTALALSSSVGAGFSASVPVHLREEQPVGVRQEGERDGSGGDRANRKRGRRASGRGRRGGRTRGS